MLHLAFADAFSLFHLVMLFGHHFAHIMGGSLAMPGVSFSPLGGAPAL